MSRERASKGANFHHGFSVGIGAVDQHLARENRRKIVPTFHCDALKRRSAALLAVFGAAAWSATLLIPRTREEPPKQPSEHFHFQRAFPAHDIPAGAYRRALDQARVHEMARYRRTSSTSWIAEGPTNVGGRITGIAVDPAQASRIYVAAADGGVWRTEDGGTNWTPLLDELGGMSTGAIVHHPSVPGVLLVGTGEANASGDSYDGIGILKTTDFGASWQLAGLPESQRIGRLAYDLTNPQVIHAAVSGGLFSKGGNRGMYRSTDGGTTWQQTLFVSDSTSAIDVVVDPTDGTKVYAAFWERIRGPDFRRVAGPTSGIWKSTDGGTSWSPLVNGLPSGSSVGRIGLAIAPSSPSVLYAIYADTPGFFAGVYKTVDGGNSWARIDDGSDLANLYSSFGWYFGNIRVAPTNPNLVYALGVSLYRSTNGGADWSNVTGSQHVDFHDLWINPSNPSNVITGNDGGFYVSSTGTGNWVKKDGLAITQFYAITVDPQVPSRVYGGTQDNSTVRTPTGLSDDYDVLIGGDGFTVVVDPLDSDTFYGEAQYGWLRKSTDFGSSFFSILDGVSGSDRVNWHMPFVMDANDNQTLYLGTHRVYRTTNAGSSWSAISPDLTNGAGSGNLTFGTITTLAVAPSAPATIYAGADDGSVHVTTNGGAQWTSIDALLPVRYVTRVAVDPFDDATAYATLSGYRLDEDTPHVLRTTNWGASWADISGPLPDAPVNDIVVDPLDTNRLFVATDVGVYFTADLGLGWEKLGQGLPLSVIVDLELHTASRVLVAGTHGRSSFSLDLTESVDVPAEGTPASATLHLGSPVPNPSREGTTFSFSLERRAHARLSIHDVGGRLVRVLFEGEAKAGTNTVSWDGRGSASERAAPGIYFARLAAEGVTRTVKISRLEPR
jgi:photosystem II stability/assembly factor-like uncharacterized protein